MSGHNVVIVCRDTVSAIEIRRVIPVDTIRVGELTGQRWDTIICSHDLKRLEMQGWFLDDMPTFLRPGGTIIWV